MRRALLLALILGGILLLTSSGPEGRPRLGAVPRMAAERVALDPGDPGRRRVGALSFLGGVRLTSSDPAFGGFSAMRVVGDAFTLVSDGGTVGRFRMGADFVPRDIRFGDLPDGPATGAIKAQRDSESLAWDPRTGSVWIGFENANAIWRYDAALAASSGRARPAAMRGWSENGGPESMARMPDGSFIVISETSRPKSGKGREALRFAGDPVAAPDKPTPFVYMPPPGYDPSDAAALPDGRLLVLNRRLSFPALFTASIVLVDPRGLKAGAVLRGIEIALFAPPLLRDNFEALAVTREGADTILWLASDDNQQFWEKSLLLKFRVEFGPAARAGQAKSPPSARRTGSR